MPAEYYTPYEPKIQQKYEDAISNAQDLIATMQSRDDAVGDDILANARKLVRKLDKKASDKAKSVMKPVNELLDRLGNKGDYTAALQLDNINNQLRTLGIDPPTITGLVNLIASAQQPPTDASLVATATAPQLTKPRPQVTVVPNVFPPTPGGTPGGTPGQPPGQPPTGGSPPCPGGFRPSSKAPRTCPKGYTLQRFPDGFWCCPDGTDSPPPGSSINCRPGPGVSPPAGCYFPSADQIPEGRQPLCTKIGSAPVFDGGGVAVCTNGRQAEWDRVLGCWFCGTDTSTPPQPPQPPTCPPPTEPTCPPGTHRSQPPGVVVPPTEPQCLPDGNPPNAAEKWCVVKDEDGKCYVFDATNEEPPDGSKILGCYPNQLAAVVAKPALCGIDDIFIPLPDTPTLLAETCGKWSALMIGTPEWCDAIDLMLDTFSDIGYWVCEAVVGLKFNKCKSNPNDTFELDSNQNPNEEAKYDAAVNNIVGNLYEPVSSTANVLLTAGGNAIAEAIVAWFTKFLGYTLKGSGASDQFTASVMESKNVGAIFASGKATICDTYALLTKCAGCNPVQLLGLLCLKACIDLFRNIVFDVICGVAFVGCAWAKGGSKLILEIPQLRETIDYMIRYVCPERIPEKGEIIEMYRRGVITEKHATTLFRCYGYPAFWLDNEILGKRAHLSAHEIIEADRRGMNDVATVDVLLDRHGYHDPKEREIVKRLYDHVPSTQELLHFLQRNTWSREFIETFRLAEGFAEEQIVQEELAKLDGQQGNPQQRPFWWDIAGQDLQAQSVTRSTAFQHFASHWLPIAVGEAQEMLRRLRPGRVDPNIEFTKANFLSVLAEQDKTPFSRERLLYLSYNVMSIRQLLQLYEFSSITRDELVEVLKDEGYKPSDADMLAKALDQRKAIYRAQTAHGFTVGKIIEFYQNDLMTEQVARVQMSKLGITDDEANTAFDVADNESRVEHKKKMLSITKTCYQTGKLTDGSAVSQLQTQGWTDRRITDILTQWRSERLCNMHDTTAGLLIKSFERRLVSASEVVIQLLRLNFSPYSISVLIGNAYYEIASKLTHERQAAERKAEALAKAIQRTIERQQRSKKHADQIKLNLDRAIVRANDQLAKAEEKAKNKQDTAMNKQENAKKISERKAKAIEDTAKEKLLSSPKQTPDQKRAMERMILEVKNQLLLDLATTKGALEKAQLKVQAASDIADIRDAYLPRGTDPNVAWQAIMDGKAQLELDLTNIRNELVQEVGGSGEIDDATRNSIDHAISEAMLRYAVESEPPV